MTTGEHAATRLSGVDATVVLQAMALDVPDTPGHPNKHPFKGILTRIDQPSDRPPEGSRGHRVILTRAAAEAALPTLLGMPVDFQSDLSGHDVRSKIGTITAAVIEGDAIHIEGFLYAADFPDEVARIQSQRDALGFSYEMANIYVKDVTAEAWEITRCVFTGAAILYKDKAAYTTTQLAAQAEENTDMSKEILEAITKLSDSLGAVTTQIDTVTTRLDKIEASQTETAKTIQASKEHLDKIEPHAAALESCAAAMDAAGIGGHPRMGHVKACRAMADHLRASAAMGKLADMWPGFDGFHAAADQKVDQKADAGENTVVKALQDQVASLTTQIADLKAASSRQSNAPERKTLPPQITSLLARNGITLPSGEAKLNVGELNGILSKSSLDTQQRMEIKAAMTAANLLAA